MNYFIILIINFLFIFKFPLQKLYYCFEWGLLVAIKIIIRKIDFINLIVVVMVLQIIILIIIVIVDLMKINWIIFVYFIIHSQCKSFAHRIRIIILAPFTSIHHLYIKSHEV